MVQRENKSNGYATFWRKNEESYGIFEIGLECFHSRDHQACFFFFLTKTKEDVWIKIEFDSRRISWGHQHGRRSERHMKEHSIMITWLPFLSLGTQTWPP